ncbi:unnamed protein product [Phaedon cochleariae]|uniref:Serine/threonine-protein phosphatase 2A activator n=1 Tax=Phaedon cochleariae TaxID=80249 RepID=A0A9P0GSB9_PHACE|nr:unnamed protein product [Phaedon cochleariae]
MGTTEQCNAMDNHQFITPMKLVRNMDDMLQWDKSEAHFEYLGFIYAVNDAVKGKSNAQGGTNVSEGINKVLQLLDQLSQWVDDIPAIQQPQRFGNIAFREWYNKLKSEAIPLLHQVLPENLHRGVPEIMIYLVEGFGNSTRIDYGTGHELSFVMFLCALFKIGYLKEEDMPATACKVFVKYLELARKLQVTYRMEPAGSHGVWSLDDYQFVPFIWGSAQFIGNPKFEPTSFLKDSIVNAYAHDYMFLACIQYINQVKTGPFAEHSNQLWSVSGVSGWSKINGGLIKMYKGEVLSKFPLVQHIYFGSLFTLKSCELGASTRRPRLSGTAPPNILAPPSGKPGSASEFKQPASSTKALAEENSITEDN